jgi:hypothetical protein
MIEDYERRQAWIQNADNIVADACKQEGYELPSLLKDALIQAIRLHHLSEAGAFCLVEAYANVERQAGRLPLKPFPFEGFKES